MCFTLSKTEIIILAVFDLSSANAKNFDQSKNLLFDKDFRYMWMHKQQTLACDKLSPSTSSGHLTSYNAWFSHVKRKLVRTGSWQELVTCQYGFIEVDYYFYATKAYKGNYGIV